MVAALRAGIGVFSALCCLAVIIVIVKLKRYSVPSQRLVLYLAIAAMLHSVSYSFARVNYYTPRYLYDGYCYFGGFFSLYSSWVEVLALFCLTFNLFYNCVMIRMPPLWLERAYLVVMYGLPLVWSWVPFLFHTYATAKGWCDMRMVDENCNPFLLGLITRFALWYGPLYLVLFLCFLASIIAAIRIRKWYGTIFSNGGDNSRLKLKNEILTLIGYPVVYLLLTVFSLANTIYSAVYFENTTTLLVLWYLRVLTATFRGAVIAVVYALDSCSRKWNTPGTVNSLPSFCQCLRRNKINSENECLLDESITPKVYSDNSWIKVDLEERVHESALVKT